MNDLIHRCITQDQRSYFQALGMCLGYGKWAEDWKGMMTERRAEQEVGVVRAESGNKPVQPGTVLEVSCIVTYMNGGIFEVLHAHIYLT